MIQLALVVGLKKKSIKDILSLVSGELETLDHRLINEISPSSRALCGILQDIFAAGGKRLRPALSFLFTKALGHSVNEPVYLIAEISELIHTASLVHDDIIDNSLIRRGKPSTNSKFDNAVTVISGDFMFARAAVNLGKLGINEITALYAAVLEDLCDGEIRQVERKFSTEVDWDYYYSKTYKKTASLFEASCQAPCLALSPNYQAAASKYGKELGLAFQIIDDVLDYRSDAKSLGKPVCSDLREGQITAPVLVCLEQSSAADRDELISIIQRIANSEIQFDQRVLELLETNNAIERSIEMAQAHCKEAIAAITTLADSESKTALIELATWVSEQA